MASKVSARGLPAWLFCQIRRTVLKLMFTPACWRATRQLLLCDITILCEFLDAEWLAHRTSPSPVANRCAPNTTPLFVSVNGYLCIRAIIYRSVIISKMVLAGTCRWVPGVLSYG